MKKINLIILVMATAAIASSCRSGKHVIVSTNTNGDKIALEYFGTVVFTDDSSAIKSMSPHGYVKFEKDGEKLSAERDLDAITYKHNDGTKSSILSETEKQLIASVLQKVGKGNKQ